MGSILVGPHAAVLKTLSWRKGVTPTLKLELSVRRGAREKKMLRYLSQNIGTRVTLELRPRPPGKIERVRLRLREFVPQYEKRVVRVMTGWGI